MEEQIKKLLLKLKSEFSSERGKNIFLYLIFVLVSFVFWTLLELNNPVQRDYVVNITITSVPDSVTIINDLPKTITVNVKDKGSSLLGYSFGNNPSININFKDFSDGNGNIVVPAIKLRSLVNDAFDGVTLMSINPESLKSKYTTNPPKKVPVIIDANIEPDIKYVLSGSVTPITDSVEIYGAKSVLNGINAVHTYNFEEKGLKDTLKRHVKIAPLLDVKIVPSGIDVVIPIEPLITKRVQIPVVSRGVPYGINMITFPSKVSVQYLVPATQYKESQDFVAEVYYDEILDGNKKLKLYLNRMEWSYGSITLGTDSVEYIIDKK